MIAEALLIKSLNYYKKLSSLMITSTKCFILHPSTLCLNYPLHLKSITIVRYDLILLILIALRPCFLIHIIFLSHSDHTCLLVLVTKNSLFKNSSTFMSLNNWVKQVKCLSSLGLWHLMRSSLHCNENDSWENLFEAWMLRICEPRIAIYKDVY